MELKDEIQRIAVAKPVAWKPSPSKFQSFSALLASDHHDHDHDHDDDDHHAPPPVVTAAIRPKTVRLKLATSIVLNQDPTFMNNSFKVELPAPAPDLYSSSTSMNMIYKPLARSVVTKNINTHSLSDNIMAPQPNMDDHDPIDVKRIQASKIIEQNKSFPPWYDGYTWRKYGQKQVKGSEYPRSYYKCTHPSCPVKKMIERSLSGKIEEIVYKGEHNHPKPRPDKRSLGLGLDQISGELEGKTSQIATFGLEDGNNTSNNIEPKLIKRRKSELVFGTESMGNDKVTSVETETETIGDTYRWRKYGQKAVKGNPYPRSYYRCTNLKCSARKYVERSSDEPNALITTYEGKHNHDMPAASSKPKF